MPTTSIWHHADFQRLIGALFVSQLGAKLAREALPLTAVLVLGAGPLAMSGLSVATALPALLLALHAGAFIDRIRRRPAMIAADLLRFLVLLSVPLAAFAGWLSLGQLGVVAFFVSAFSLAFDVADQAYLPGLVGRDQVLKANAVKESSDATTEIVGPPLGGLLVQMIGGPLTILIDAVSYLVSALLLLRIKGREERQAPAAGASLRREIVDGLRVLWRDSVLRPLLFARFFRAFFGSMLGPFYVLYLITELRLSPFTLGLIIAVGGAASMAGAALAPVLLARLPAGPALIGAFALKAIGLACVPLAGYVAGGSLSVLVVGLLVAHQFMSDGSTGFFAVVERTLRQRRVPPTHLGRTGATIRLVNDGALPFAAILGGVIAEGHGIQLVMWIAVTGYAIAPAIAFFSEVRRVRGI